MWCDDVTEDIGRVELGTIREQINTMTSMRIPNDFAMDFSVDDSLWFCHDIISVGECENTNCDQMMSTVSLSLFKYWQ
jgi:hypothetical protein